MKIICEECGSIIMPETEFSDMSKLQRQHELIINHEENYKSQHQDYLNNRMKKYIGDMIRLQNIKTELIKRWNKTTEDMMSDIITDFRKWEKENANQTRT